MEIVIGADHRGFEMKALIKQYVVGNDDPIAWIDVGTDNDERSDYPIYAAKAVRALLTKEATKAILLCASGIGMAIVANRFPSIYAGIAWNEQVARAAKEDDNCNVLVLPASFIDDETAIASCNAWLGATFKGGRYQKRIDMIDAIKV